MHELAICQALIGQVTDVARSNHAASVSDVFVSVGPLSGVEGPLLQNAFPVAAAGTVAGTAKLHLQSMPIRVRCDECGQESEAGMNRLVCEHCGDWRTRLISGDELLLQRVILESAAAGGQSNV